MFRAVRSMRLSRGMLGTGPHVRYWRVKTSGVGRLPPVSVSAPNCVSDGVGSPTPNPYESASMLPWAWPPVTGGVELRSFIPDSQYAWSATKPSAG